MQLAEAGFVPVSRPNTSIKFMEKEMFILLKTRERQKLPKPVFHYPFINSNRRVPYHTTLIISWFL